MCLSPRRCVMANSSERGRPFGPRKDGVELLSVRYDELREAGLASTCHLLACYALSDAQAELAAIERFNLLACDPAADEAAIDAARREMERLSAVAVGSFERYRVAHLALRTESEVLV